MNFSFFDLLLIIIFSQGLFLLVALQLMPNKNKEANMALTMMLAVASFMSLGRVLIYHIKSEFILRLGAGIDASIYLFGPFLYLYVRRLTFKEDKVFRLHWVHFGLAILYSLYFLWNLCVDISSLQAFKNSRKAYFLYFFVELFGILSISFYLFKSYKLYQVFKKNQEKEVSFNQQVVRYLRSLLWSLSIFVFLWLFSFINAYGFQRYFVIINYDMMWISSALLIYFIGFYSLTQPHIFRIQLPKNTTEDKLKSRLKPNEIKKLTKLIEHALKDEKIYLESTLNLVSFAERIKTTTNNLSWILNNVYKRTFYEFVNEYRVKDFIERVKLNQHKNLTIFSIALEVGFNSKSTFNKAFKTIVKDTPSSYIKKLETSLKLNDCIQTVD